MIGSSKNNRENYPGELSGARKKLRRKYILRYS